MEATQTSVRPRLKLPSSSDITTVTGEVITATKKTKSGKHEKIDKAAIRKVFAPRALTKEVITQLVKLVKKGLPFDGACDYLGVRPDQFWLWLRRGDLYLTAGETPPEDKIYGDFVQEIKAGFAEYRLDQIEELQRRGNRNWFRNLMILERRDRKNFGKTEAPGGTEESFQADERFL